MPFAVVNLLLVAFGGDNDFWNRCINGLLPILVLIIVVCTWGHGGQATASLFALADCTLYIPYELLVRLIACSAACSSTWSSYVHLSVQFPVSPFINHDSLSTFRLLLTKWWSLKQSTTLVTKMAALITSSTFSPKVECASLRNVLRTNGPFPLHVFIYKTFVQLHRHMRLSFHILRKEKMLLLRNSMPRFSATKWRKKGGTTWYVVASCPILKSTQTTS